MALRYKDFPIYLTPSSFVTDFSNKAPTFFLAALYSSSVVGFYGLAYYIIKLPTDLIGKSVQNVFFAEIANIKKENPEEIKRLSNNLLKKLFILTFFPTLALFWGAPLLFALVFGQDWYETGIFVRLLSPLMLSQLCFGPVTKVWIVFERQKEILIINTAKVIFSLCIFASAAAFSIGPHLTILYYSIGMSFIHFIKFIVSQKIINEAIKDKTSGHIS